MSNITNTPSIVQNYILPPQNQQMQIQEIVFDASTGQDLLDLSYAQSQQQSFVVQSFIVDTRNLSSGASITILIGQNLQFPITIPSGVYQSYNIPALPITWFKITSTNGASGTCPIWLQNFPVLPQSYTNSSGTTTQNVNVTNTSIPVTFPSAQPVSINGAPLVSIQNNTNGSVLGTDFKDLVSNAATTTLTTTTLSTLSSGLYTDINLRILPNTSIATSGTVNCTVHCGSAWSLIIPMYITNTPSTSEVFIKIYNGSSRPITFGSLTAQLDTAIATGGIVVFGSYIATRSIVD